MRDIQERRPKLGMDAFEFHPQIGAQFGIERGQGFVHQIDARVANQGAADGHALHLAA